MSIKYAVSSIFTLPMEVIHPNAVGERIEFRSVFPASLDAVIGGNVVQVRRYEGPSRCPPERDPRILTVYVMADSMIEAAEAALGATEWVTDYLAFSFACYVPIQSQSIEVVGGQEASIGEPMDIPKFRRTDVHMNVTWQSPFSLIDRPGMFCENRRAALRWYHKGTANPYDVDRFIFFWIALEILAKADEPELVPMPFKHACGYELHKCPACDEDLSRPPQGEAALVAQYMTDLGVTGDEIKAIRQFRQIVHGKGKLTLAGTRNVERYNEVLRRAINLALKRALNIPDNSPPLIRVSMFTRNVFGSYVRNSGDGAPLAAPASGVPPSGANGED